MVNQHTLDWWSDRINVKRSHLRSTHQTMLAWIRPHQQPFIFLFYFLINFYWRIIALQCLLVSTVQQSESAVHVRTSPLFLEFLFEYICDNLSFSTPKMSMKIRKAATYLYLRMQPQKVISRPISFPYFLCFMARRYKKVES